MRGLPVRHSDDGSSAVENMTYVVIALVAVLAIALYGRTVWALFDHVTPCASASECVSHGHVPTPGHP